MSSHSIDTLLHEMSSDVCDISKIAKHNYLLVLEELGKYFKDTQKHWDILSDKNREMYSLIIMPTRSGLKDTDKKYNYEYGRYMFITEISVIIVHIDEVYYVYGHCMWAEPYEAEINVEADDKCRSIGSNFGFSDDSLICNFI